MTATFDELDQAAGGPAPQLSGPLLAIVAQVQADHPDLDEVAAWEMARDLAGGVTAEQRKRLVRRLVDDADAAKAMSLARARVVTADQFVKERTSPPAPCLGGLVSEGHNAILVASKKTGKSTVVENVARSLTTGTSFLGIFEVHRSYRVAVLNFEMTEDDERDRLRALGMPDDALERLLLLNLRGAGLSLTAAPGRAWLVEQLKRHGSEVAIIDTYGAASAPSVESENDNAGGRRFLMAWDSIKAEADVHTSIITHHTGRAVVAEGEERGRGATVLEDWADVIIMLTRDRESGHRFLASEGRSAYNLPESRLWFDDITRTLTLPESAVGENRSRSRQDQHAAMVVKVVTEQPGILTTALRTALTEIGNNQAKAAAIEAARRKGLVHVHAGAGVKVHHFRGPLHAETEPCPDPNYTPSE